MRRAALALLLTACAPGLRVIDSEVRAGGVLLRPCGSERGTESSGSATSRRRWYDREVPTVKLCLYVGNGARMPVTFDGARAALVGDNFRAQALGNPKPVTLAPASGTELSLTFVTDGLAAGSPVRLELDGTLDPASKPAPLRFILE